MLIGGLMFQSFGFYVNRLEDEFEWSKTTFSLAFAMTRIESGLLGPLQGWAIDRYGPRIMIRIGITTTALGFLLFSQINSVTTFFLTFFLIAVGASMAGFVTLVVAIVNWFQKKRSLALGLMSAGFAVGGFMAPLVVFSMNEIGWRNTSIATGVLIFVVGQIIATFIYHRPEDRGETIDGEPAPETMAAARGSGPVVIPANEDFTTGEALRAPTFWFISIGHAGAVLIIGALMVHLVEHLEDLGHSAYTAAFVILLMTVFQFVGQVGGGYLGDRLNKRVMLAACMVGHVVALLLVTFRGGVLDDRALRGAQRAGVGHARTDAAGAAGGLLRANGLRQDHGLLLAHRDDGDDGRADHRGRHGGRVRDLRAWFHRVGRGRGAGNRLLRDGGSAAAADRSPLVRAVRVGPASQPAESTGVTAAAGGG